MFYYSQRVCNSINPRTHSALPTPAMDQPQPQNVYEGYHFFKCDPPLGHQPARRRVERDSKDLELCKTIHRRPFQISAASQYKALSNERRFQVDQLMYGRRERGHSVLQYGHLKYTSPVTIPIQNSPTILSLGHRFTGSCGVCC